MNAPAPAPAAIGPQFIIVDGKMVLDTSSLQQRREALPEVAMEEVHQDDNKFTTQNSFLKSRAKPLRWTAEETRKFYNEGLKSCGLDFTLMQATVFPYRERVQVLMHTPPPPPLVCHIPKHILWPCGATPFPSVIF